MDYSIEKRLKELADTNERNEKIYSFWCINKKIYTDALAAISYYYPHYSLHDSSHSESIISKIEMVLGEERIKDLEPTDLFLILMCAYSHDIGMIVTNTDIEKILENGEFTEFIKIIQQDSFNNDLLKAANYLLEIESNPSSIKNKKYEWALEVKDSFTLILAEFFRRRHGIRGSIKDNELKDKNISNILQGNIPQRIIKLIGDINSCHILEFDEMMKKLKVETNGFNDIAHPRFIACMLRLGDLLDLDDGRFNEVFMKLLSDFPKSSEIHIKKHRSISHFLITEEKIEVNSICTDDESDVYSVTRGWFDWLKDELKNLTLYWNKIVPKGFKGTAPVDGGIYVNFEDNRMEELAEIKFNINSEKAFELFIGDNLYESKLVFIRELIQNSLDASKLQMWKDINSGIYDNVFELTMNENEKREYNYISDIPKQIYNFYPICITLKKEEKNELKFVIEDNGRGMSKEDIKRIANIGGSYVNDNKAKDLINTSPYWLKPTGNFGIGLQSVFQVTKKFTCETKSDSDQQGYVVEFQSGRDKGYIKTKINNEKYMKRGTKISFNISIEDLKEYFKSVDMGILQGIMEDKMSFDYFADSNEKMIVKSMIEFIRNILYKRVTFPLKIKIKNINDYPMNKPKDIINGYEDNLKKDNELEYLVGINKHESNTYESYKDGIIYIKAYDKITKSEIKIKFFRGGIGGQLFFNDINVQRHSHFHTPCLEIEWNIFGHTAMELLKFSREEIKPEMKKILEDELINNLIPRCIKQVNKYIFELSVSDELNQFKELKWYKESIFCLRLANNIYLREEEIEKKLWESLSEYDAPDKWLCEKNKNYFFDIESFIRLVQKNEEDEEWERTKSNYNVVLVNEIDNEVLKNNYGLLINPTLEMDIKFSSFTNPIREMRFYDDEKNLTNSIEFQKYLEKNFYLKEIKKIDKDKYVLIIRKGIFKSVQVDQEETIKDIINDLYDENIIRTRIYPIYTQENNFGDVLAVNRMTPLIGDKEGMMLMITNNLGFENHFIISPFIGHKSIPFNSSLDEIIDWLRKNGGLDNLINWVYENSINRKSFEQVEQAYYKLIELYIRCRK